MDCAKTHAHADFFECRFVAADCHRLFAGSPAPLRSQHTVIAAKKHPCESRSRENHAQDARALGTCPGDCSWGKSAGTARLLAKNFRALAAASDSRQNQKLLYTRGALSVTKLDASKSTTIERDQFPGSARDVGRNAGCRRIQPRFIRAGIHVA